MQEQKLSPNVAHATSLQTLSAALELGTKVIMNCMGTEMVSTGRDSQVFTEQDISEALSARLAKKLKV